MSAACRRWYPKWLEIVATAARTGLRQAIQSWWAPPGPRNHRNRTPYTDDRDHSKGVIGDVLLLKRELKQRRDSLPRCTQDWKSCVHPSSSGELTA
jgi:hypothetical protein